MSASPADHTPGRTPNGTLAPMIRRPKAPVNPLVQPKKIRRPLPTDIKFIKPPNGTQHQNGAALFGQGASHVIATHPPPPPRAPIAGDSSKVSTIISEGSGPATSLFTSPPTASFTDYPLIMTKKALAESVRLHIARFASKRTIDPRNEDEFTRPVRLHRRDPKAPPGGGPSKDLDAMEGVDTKAGILEEDKEREQAELLREARETERKAQMALIAPSASSGNQNRSGAFKKKTQQVFRNDQTEEEKAGTKLRYEEALPWHVEDFDCKQTWVGTYEAALSETQAQLVHQGGNFYVTPVEKWYKFATKVPFNILSLDDAEKSMNRKVKDPRWFMTDMEAKAAKQVAAKNKKVENNLYVGKVTKAADGNVRNTVMKGEGGDLDEIDLEEDGFADDDEDPVIEGEEEDKKQAADKIRKDYLGANVFDLKNEDEYDKAERLEKLRKAAEREHGKKLKKTIRKREKDFNYSSDSDNPYSSGSDSSDSEAERLKDEQTKKEAEEKKAVAAEKAKVPPSSGSSTKGTNTPSHRPSKHANSLDRTASSGSLKRPGSPNLSEASGNESTRKKKKKQHGLGSSLHNGISTPNGPPSRPRSPNPPPPSSAPLPPSQTQQQPDRKAPAAIPSRPDKRPRGPGTAASGSDGEGAGSGGETSDGTRKRIKLKLSSPTSKPGSPTRSRAGSPAAAAAVPDDHPRAASSASSGDPTTATTTTTTTASLPASFPTAEELRAHIPPGGTTVADLIKSFKGAVVGLEKKNRFTEMLRTVSRYDKETRLVMPR